MITTLPNAIFRQKRSFEFKNISGLMPQVTECKLGTGIKWKMQAIILPAFCILRVHISVYLFTKVFDNMKG